MEKRQLLSAPNAPLGPDIGPTFYWKETCLLDWVKDSNKLQKHSAFHQHLWLVKDLFTFYEIFSVIQKQKKGGGQSRNGLLMR